MSDVFISYAREDRQLAQALASDLAARGFAVWWDAALLGSDDYQDVILEALGKAKAAIVIWTKHSAKSRFVRDEARFALHLEKLVAVKTAELDVFAIPFGFQGQHTENVTDREQIVRAITKLGARAAAGTRQVAPASLPAASRIDWDALKTSGTAEQVLSFLETGPSEVQRREATARLRQLMAVPQGGDNARNSVVRSLSMSNWEAFVRGLYVPPSELSAHDAGDVGLDRHGDRQRAAAAASVDAEHDPARLHRQHGEKVAAEFPNAGFRAFGGVLMDALRQAR